jgi:hypothetical protein
VLMAPAYLVEGRFDPPLRVAIAAGMAGLGAALLILVTVLRFGLQRIRTATMVPLLILLVFIFGVGPVFGIPALEQSKQTIDLLNLTYSPRPLAEVLARISPPPGIVAVYRVRRDTEYGLSFYRDHRVVDYDRSPIPEEQHLLVTREPFTQQLPGLLAGRQYRELFEFRAQGLFVYQVDAAQATAAPGHAH